MEKILSIEIVHSLKGIAGAMYGSHGTRMGMGSMINAVFGGYGEYDGYRVKTSEHEYLVLISNEQSCCENWGYLISEDDPQRFIGTELLEVEVTDTNLMVEKLSKVEPYGFDQGGIQFVSFKTNKGVFQIAVYNNHNGYYGHGIWIIKDEEVLLSDSL